MQAAGEAAEAGGKSLKRPREGAEAAEFEQRKFKVDFDILECPICSEPFSPPVYQCENGHTACASCCKKFTKGCPTCSQPIGRIRNLAIEKMIESMEADCKYASYGCKEMLKLSQRDDHENALCEHRMIQCPVPGHGQFKCPRSSMRTHLMTEHNARMETLSEASKSASFILEPLDEYVVLKSKEKWLLLHCWAEKPRGAVRIYCISFGAPEKVPLYTKRVPYKLTVQAVKNNRIDTVVYNMQAAAKDCSWVQDWNFDYLVLPKLRTDRPRRYNLDVTVSLV